MSAPQAAEIYNEIAIAQERNEAAEAEAIVKELEALELPSEDGIPLETNWHRIQMNLLIDSVNHLWRDRQDYFVGGNMFIYYSLRQARNQDYRGPDFFVVKHTDDIRDRDSWVVWEEDGRYPDVIVELASRSTITNDLGEKKRLYEQTFRTPEYFCYDPRTRKLFGWKLQRGAYVETDSDEQGRLQSEELGVWLGTWEGEFQRIPSVWLRFYAEDGQLILTPSEAEAIRAEAEAIRAEAEAMRAEAEAKRAEAEVRRADKAEAELARLKSLLSEHGITDVEK